MSRNFGNFIIWKREARIGSPRNRTNPLVISKRQKFVIAVVCLSLGLFFSEYLFGKSSIFFAIFLGLITELFIVWAMYRDLEHQFTYHIFILPFLYSVAFALFYFLIPARLLTRIILTGFYLIGLYSMFLSQNIFTVASIRTIALLSGARIVSFIVTLISFFFLANIVFSLHWPVLITSLLLFCFAGFFILHSLWTYTLERRSKPLLLWVSGLALCISEVSLLLWFWPSSPTLIALFLTGFFYIIVGLSHVWVDRRLFRNVLWEYSWVAFVVFFIFIVSTAWRR